MPRRLAGAFARIRLVCENARQENLPGLIVSAYLAGELLGVLLEIGTRDERRQEAAQRSILAKFRNSHERSRTRLSDAESFDQPTL